MKMNIDSAEKRVNEIIAQKNKEISTIKESIAKAEASADNARKLMLEATTAGDGHKYSSAKDELRTAEDIIEMQKLRLDSLENQPLIDQKEYEELSTAIKQSVSELVDKDIAEIKRIYAQLDSMRDKEEAMLARCNELLSVLQLDIMMEKLSSGVTREQTNLRKLSSIVNPYDLSNEKYISADVKSKRQ